MSDRMAKIIAAGEADAEAFRAQERARVVAWLREQHDFRMEEAGYGMTTKGWRLLAVHPETEAHNRAVSQANTLHWIMGAIQRGEHLKETGE